MDTRRTKFIGFRSSSTHFSCLWGIYLKYKKFGLKAGARIEHSMLQAELHSDTQPDFDADFTDVVPTANLSYQLPDTKQ